MTRFHALPGRPQSVQIIFVVLRECRYKGKMLVLEFDAHGIYSFFESMKANLSEVKGIGPREVKSHIRF